MSNRQARREQSRQARRQATSYRGGRPARGDGGGASGGGGGRGPNFLSWPFLIGVSVLAAILLALVIVLALRDGGGDEQEAVENLSVIDQALADLPVEMQQGNKLGPDDAPVKLIQYEDFQCPHCLRYTLDIEPTLVEEFVKPGLLQIEFRHYPVVGIESQTAARGAVCAAEQNRMFEYANRLFAKHAEAGNRFRADQGTFAEDKLVEIAGNLGLNTDEFESCMDEPDTLSTVANNLAAAQAIGFRGTPSFIINGAPVQSPPQTAELWRELVQGVIDEIVTAEEEAESEGEAGDEGDAEAEDGAGDEAEGDGEADAGDDDGS